MSQEAQRIFWLSIQRDDLQHALRVLPRGPRTARLVGRTRKNLARVDDILVGLAGRVIAAGVRP
jgi:hypothetical protein